MSVNTKNIIIFSLVLLSIVFWGVILYFFKPQEIIKNIGVTNSYIFIFLMATFSGVSSFTSTSHYATVFTFAAGGLNPFLISIFAGIGMTIGDSVFYYLGKRGAQSLPESVERKFQSIKCWIEKKSKKLLPAIVYMYTGFTPLPGDFLSIFLGITSVKYKTIIVPIILGNMTLMLWISFFAQAMN